MIQKKDCCGCSACFAVCPVNAITMCPDEEGFLYPQIDETRCTHCNLCLRVCSFHENYCRSDYALEIPLYKAVVHKDADIRKASRSGGVFVAMAQHILTEGGIVYGVAMDQSWNAYVARIMCFGELSRLQGSKYVQSDKGSAYLSVMTDLLSGKLVLYSGTGCEIAGLLSFLCRKNVSTENLYTCDLVCHGVPSPKLWKENVAQVSKKFREPIEHISFRDKGFGWRPHIESYQNRHKKVYSNRYTALFYSHLMLRPSCSNCHFCNYERCSDVTIADFWGVEKTEIPLEYAKGVSLLMVHTEKGKTLLQAIGENAETFDVPKETTVQPNLLRPSSEGPAREQFWADYRARGYQFVSQKYYSLEMRLKLIYNLIFRKEKY